MDEVGEERDEPEPVVPEDEWPGLESLPPEPPVDWGPPKPVRARPPDPDPLPDAPPAAPDPLPASPEPVAVARRRPVLGLVTLAAVLAALAVAATSVALTPTDAGTAAAEPSTTAAAGSVLTTVTTAPPTTPTTRATSTTTFPPHPCPDDALLRDALVEVGSTIVTVRRRPFLAAVPAERLADEAFDARLRERFDPTDVANLASWYALLGLAEPNDDLAERYIDAQVKAAVAYYDPTAKQIVLRGEPCTPVLDEQKSVLVHELSHAHDDQHFPADRPAVTDLLTEAAFGYSAATEGNAMRMELAHARRRGQRPGVERPHAYADITSADINAKYDYGLPLVLDAADRGGEPAVDELLANPLTTSEQVMHLDKSRSRQPEAAVELPPGDGAADEAGPVGELLTRQLLVQAVGHERADEAAQGWGGDRSVRWLRPDGHSCLRIRYVMDTPADLSQLEGAFAEWTRRGKDRTLRREGDHLDVTTCGPVPPPRARTTGID